MKKNVLVALFGLFLLNLINVSISLANKHFKVSVNNTKSEARNVTVELWLYKDNSKVGYPIVAEFEVSGSETSTFDVLEPSVPEEIKNQLIQSGSNLSNYKAIVIITNIASWKKYYHKFPTLNFDGDTPFIKIPDIQCTL